jgi:hypothetical protein
VSVRGSVSRLLWAFVATIFLFGCETSGIAEFQTYRTAYEATYATSTAILDQLAIQERVIVRKQLKLAQDPRFYPDLAAYYTDVGDPPGTAAVRRAVATVKTYNDLLYGLASGETAQALVARAATLNTNLLKAVESSAAVVSVKGNAPITAALNGAFTQIQPYLEIAMKYRTRQAFRSFLLEHAELVREILVELRNGSAFIFPILTDELLREAEGDDAKVAAYRKLLGDWVIMMDNTIVAFDVAVEAVKAPPTLSSTIAGVSAVSVDLQVAADAARKHLAEASVK